MGGILKIIQPQHLPLAWNTPERHREILNLCESPMASNASQEKGRHWSSEEAAVWPLLEPLELCLTPNLPLCPPQARRGCGGAQLTPWRGLGGVPGTHLHPRCQGALWDPRGLHPLQTSQVRS